MSKKIKVNDILCLVDADNQVAIVDQFRNPLFDGRADVALVANRRLLEMNAVSIIQKESKLNIFVYDEQPDREVVKIYHRTVPSITFKHILDDIQSNQIIHNVTRIVYSGDEREVTVEIYGPRCFEKMVKDMIYKYPCTI